MRICTRFLRNTSRTCSLVMYPSSRIISSSVFEESNFDRTRLA